MRYILNSAVITSPGSYEYRLIDAEEAAAWLREGGWESTIGYQETAEALSQLSGVQVPVNRRMVRMEEGDEALVFRLVLPPGERRVDPATKGSLGADYIREHCETGILIRLG